MQRRNRPGQRERYELSWESSRKKSEQSKGCRTSPETGDLNSAKSPTAASWHRSSLRSSRGANFSGQQALRFQAPLPQTTSYGFNMGRLSSIAKSRGRFQSKTGPFLLPQRLSLFRNIANFRLFRGFESLSARNSAAREAMGSAGAIRNVRIRCPVRSLSIDADSTVDCLG